MSSTHYSLLLPAFKSPNNLSNAFLYLSCSFHSLKRASDGMRVLRVVKHLSGV